MTPERSHYRRGHNDAAVALEAGDALAVEVVRARASMDSMTGLYWHGYLDELNGKADWLSSRPTSCY
jgi:hypothetical protein